MGYYTDFKVNLSKPNGEVKYKLKEIAEYTFEIKSDTELSLFDAKWYDYEKDMLELSSQFPDILFKVTGSGEEHGDIWEHYFRNGKHYYQKARIVFDDFDQSLLQS